MGKNFSKIQKNFRKPPVRMHENRGENDADAIWERIWIAEEDELSPYEFVKNQYEEMNDEEKELFRAPLNEIVEDFGDAFWEEG